MRNENIEIKRFVFCYVGLWRFTITGSKYSGIFGKTLSKTNSEKFGSFYGCVFEVRKCRMILFGLKIFLF
jgi:hypothetical protein